MALRNVALIFAAWNCVSSAVKVELRGAVSARSNATTTFTINDEVYVDGALVARSADLNGMLGCHEHPKGTSSFKVCGCHVKLEVHLMTEECQLYEQYDVQVGKC